MSRLREALGAIGRALRSVGYLISDVWYVVTRGLRLSGLTDRWGRLQRATRLRIGTAVAALVVAGGAWAFIVPALPCEFPGGDECAPSEDALDLVPAGALAYAQLTLDPEHPQYQPALEAVARTPLIAREAVGQLSGLLVGVDGEPPDFGADIAPWFGGEAAVALIGSARGNEQVQMLEVSDPEAARDYAQRIAGGETTTSEHEGVEVSQDERGLASALVGEFLVLGSAEGVRTVVSVGTGAEESLAEDQAAVDVLGELPEESLARAYLSREGIAELVASPESPLAMFEPFVDAGASTGAAVALSANVRGFEISVRSDFGEDGGGPGFFSAFGPFEAELPERLPGDTAAYLGLGDPGEALGGLLDQATAQAPDIASGLAALVTRLRVAEGLDIEEDLFDSLGEEAALAVVPREEADAGEADVAPSAVAGAPYVEFLADEVDSEQALGALARLQRPLIDELDVRLGAPSFEQVRIGDVVAQTLDVSPAVQLTYAVIDGLLVVASDPAGVERAATEDEAPLASSERYREAMDALPSEASVRAYLDLAALIRFAERSGLGADPAYAEFAEDLRRLGAFALTVRASEESLETDAQLVIEEEPTEEEGSE